MRAAHSLKGELGYLGAAEAVASRPGAGGHGAREESVRGCGGVRIVGEEFGALHRAHEGIRGSDAVNILHPGETWGEFRTRSHRRQIKC